MTVTESGMEMFTNFTQFLNAYLPMEVTESGIDTEVRCVLETLLPEPGCREYIPFRAPELALSKYWHRQEAKHSVRTGTTCRTVSKSCRNGKTGDLCICNKRVAQFF